MTILQLERPLPARPALTAQRSAVLAMALDAGRLYATRFAALDRPPYTSEQPGELVVLDPNTLRSVPELRRLPGVPVGCMPRSVAINPRTGKIYVVNDDQRGYSLTVIDGTSLSVLRTIGLMQRPHHVVVNTRVNRVYVSNPFQRRIDVINGATDALLPPIELVRGVKAMAVDETTNRLYGVVMNRSVPSGANGLQVLADDLETRQILPFVPIEPLGIDSQDVAVDVAMDRVYVANQGNIGAGSPSLTVLHRPSLRILATVPLSGPARRLAVNPAAREVYVTTDRGTVEVVNASTLTVTDHIATGPGPWAIAAVPGPTRQVYVGDRVDGSIVRLS